MYERVNAKILYITRFDENSDLGTTYLDRIDMTRSDMMKMEENFPASEQGYILGKLLDGAKSQILLTLEQASHSCPKHIILIC